MHALKTIRAKTWRLVTLAPASMLLAVLLVPMAMALVSTNEGFRSNGDLIAGWYWLRDRGLDHYAEYTFPNPPKQGDILLDINALATDHVNGGPGVDAVFNLLVGFPGARNMGGVFHRIRVTLPNVSPPSDPVGYMTSGKIRLERKILDRVIPASGELFIRIVRARSQDPHVAFRSDSVRLHNSGGSAGTNPMAEKRVLATTYVNSFLITLRLLIQSSGPLTETGLEKASAGIDDFDFGKYHSSQYRRMAEEIVKKHFGIEPEEKN